MIQELGVGLLLTLLASFGLLLCVLRELAPSGGLSGRGRWLLAGGMGLGVFSFAAKLALVALFTAQPGLSRLAQAAAPSLQRPDRRDLPEPDAGQGSPPPHYRWLALSSVVPEVPEASAALVALGERLFHDTRLSLDGSLSCASCHALQRHAGADGRATAIGVGGHLGRRNTPTVWNAALQARLFWDGRADSLEAQALGPILNPDEMAMPSAEAVLQRLRADAAWAGEAERTLGAPLRDLQPIAQALAAYERSLLSADTPYDRFVRGDAAALTAAQRRGMALFDGLGCVQCHGGANFSSAGIDGGGAAYRLFPVFTDRLDPRWRLTDDQGLNPPHSAQGVWRVPSLRNVALTAPYFHNGAVPRLDEAVRIMAQAQLGLRIGKRAQPDTAPDEWDAEQRTLRPAPRQSITEAEVQSLVAFLGALSSDRLPREPPGPSR